MNVSAVTKGGSSRFSGTVYDYWRDHKFAANDRSNSITGHGEAEEHVQLSGRQHRRSDPDPGRRVSTAPATRRSSSLGLEFQRQKVDPGSFLSTTMTDKMKAGDLSELLPGNCVGQTLNMNCAQFNIPAGFPGAGTAAPNNNFAPYIHPLGKVLAGLYPSPNLTTDNNRYNYVFNTLQPTNRDRPEVPDRLQHHEQHQRLRARGHRGRERRERPRHLVGLLGPGAADADLRRQQGPIGLGQRRQRPEPDDDQRGAGELEPADAGQLLAGSVEGADRAPTPSWRATARASSRVGSPYLPLNIITSGWGQGGPGNLWAPAMDVFAHNDALQFSDKLTKIAGIARPEVRVHRRARPEAAELPERRDGRAAVRPVGDRRHRQRGRRPADRPSGELHAGHADPAGASGATGTSTPSRRTAGSSGRTSRSSSASAPASGPTTTS